MLNRTVPRSRQDEVQGVLYCSLPSLGRDQVRQLAGFLLQDAGITYTAAELDKVVELCDGHPFNTTFLVEEIKDRTLPVILADPTNITQWKRRRANEFLKGLSFGEAECSVLATLKDFGGLDFDSLCHSTSHSMAEVSASISKLMDYHIVESTGVSFILAPPVRDAVERDPRFTLPPDRYRHMLRAISGRLLTLGEDSTVSISMVEAGVLATLQEGKELSPLFSTFLMPSHLVWLAQRRYNQKNTDPEVIRLARLAIDGRNRLSPAGRVEACRLLCLSAARLARDADFEYGIQILKSGALPPWERSNLNFLLGFNARMHGNLPEAEKYFRLAYDDSPRNFQAARELAAICLARDTNADAEKFAREAYEIAEDNAYILDILLSVLIQIRPSKGPSR